jgi:urease accessory protein
MSGAGSQFEVDILRARATLANIRVSGGIAARFSYDRAQARTVVQDLVEAGGYRLLLPVSPGAHIEAAQINTGGGVVGGDRLNFSVKADAGAAVVYATQAAERIYRSAGPLAELGVHLDIGHRATLAWLPQEAILYSDARMKRSFEADIADDGRLLLVETIVFGRVASGENMGEGLLHDVWRIRRGGQLIFADNVRLDGNIGSLLKRSAIAGGARAISLIVFVASDAEEWLAAIRSLLEDAGSDFGASAWNGMLIVRLIADDPAVLKVDVQRTLRTLHGMPLPRVWSN